MSVENPLERLLTVLKQMRQARRDLCRYWQHEPQHLSKLLKAYETVETELTELIYDYMRDEALLLDNRINLHVLAAVSALDGEGTMNK